jgi:hypothetical protein
MISKENFKKQIEKLVLVHTSITVTPERMDVWYDLLKINNNDQFIKAIDAICSTTKDIYRSTNIIALINEQIKFSKEENGHNFI